MEGWRPGLERCLPSPLGWHAWQSPFIRSPQDWFRLSQQFSAAATLFAPPFPPMLQPPPAAHYALNRSAGKPPQPPIMADIAKLANDCDKLPTPTMTKDEPAASIEVTLRSGQTAEQRTFRLKPSSAPAVANAANAQTEGGLSLDVPMPDGFLYLSVRTNSGNDLSSAVFYAGDKELTPGSVIAEYKMSTGLPKWLSLCALSGRDDRANLSYTLDAEKDVFVCCAAERIRSGDEVVLSASAESPAADADCQTPHSKVLDVSQAVDIELSDETRLLHSAGPLGAAYPCDRCGKVFSYQYYRDKHLKYTRCVDLGDRKFPCHLCPRSFEKRDRLRIHILHVHEKHRPHSCNICGKRFSQSSSLNKHLRVHSGERPYQCAFCEKSFTASSILRTHIRQHSGEKPFKCKHCGKAFASHAAHDSHVRRSHSPSRVEPHRCHVCAKTFQHSSHLRFHLQCIHGAADSDAAVAPSSLL